MLARLVPSLTGRPFTSLAASRSPTASGRATMCSTTRTRAKNTTPSFGRWLTNGFASSLSAGKSAPPITRTNTWKPLRNEAPFSLPYTCKQIHEKYGREGSGDYPGRRKGGMGQEVGSGRGAGGWPFCSDISHSGTPREGTRPTVEVRACRPRALTRRSVDRLEVEQLGAVGRQVQVKALVLQVVPGAFVAFPAQQVFHRPVVRRQVLKGERCVTLAGMRRKVHGHQVELRRLLLPLHNRSEEH